MAWTSRPGASRLNYAIHAGIEANGKGYQIGEIVEGLAPIFHVT